MKSAKGKLAMFMAMAGAMGGGYDFLSREINRAFPADSSGRKEFCYPPFEGSRDFFRVLALSQESADAQYLKFAKAKGVTVRPRLSGKEFEFVTSSSSLKAEVIGGLCLAYYERKYYMLEKAADNKITPNDLFYMPFTDKVEVMIEGRVGGAFDPNNMGAFKLVPLLPEKP